MRKIYALLEYFTEEYPPPENKNHSITLAPKNSNNCLILSIWLDNECQQIYLDDEDLNEHIDDLVDVIDETLSSISETDNENNIIVYVDSEIKRDSLLVEKFGEYLESRHNKDNTIQVHLFKQNNSIIIYTTKNLYISVADAQKFANIVGNDYVQIFAPNHQFKCHFDPNSLAG